MTSIHSRLTQFKAHLNRFPFIAILRGIHPYEVEEVGQVLFDFGFRIIEVPMNSPDTVESVKRLKNYFIKQNLDSKDLPLIGAGTVQTSADVHALAEVGCDLIISPHFDLEVVESTLQVGLISLPGVVTPSEAFRALKSGAHALKLFPAVSCPPSYVKALRAVLDEDTLLIPVGGVGLEQFGEYLDVGCVGFGLGSLVYKKGDQVDEVRVKVMRLIEAWKVGSKL